MSAQVFVGNVPADATEQELAQIFSQVGPVDHFRLLFDRQTGASKRYGFCEFRDQQSALSALTTFNGFELRGKRLRVDYAESAPRQSSGVPPSVNPQGLGVVQGGKAGAYGAYGAQWGQPQQGVASQSTYGFFGGAGVVGGGAYGQQAGGSMYGGQQQMQQQPQVQQQRVSAVSRPSAESTQLFAMVAKSMQAVLAAQIEAIRFTAAATQKDPAAAYVQLGGDASSSAGSSPASPPGLAAEPVDILAVAQRHIDRLQDELLGFSEEPSRKRARTTGSTSQDGTEQAVNGGDAFTAHSRESSREQDQ